MWTLPWQECEDKVAIFKSLEQKMEIYLNRVWKCIKNMQPLKIAINMKWKSIQNEYGNLVELRCKKVKTKENCHKHLLI